MTDDVWQGFRINRTMAVTTGGRISTRKSTLYVIGGEGICPSSMYKSPVTEAHTRTVEAPTVRGWK